MKTKEFLDDLIPRDISRCNDYKCQTARFCSRFLQMQIDEKNLETQVPVNDFEGRKKIGLCNHFLNVECASVP